MGFLLLSHPTVAVATTVTATSTQPVVYSVAMTAYNAVPEQTDGNPLETASGAFSNPEVVAARSQDLADELPFGTIVEVTGPTIAQDNCGYSVVAKRIGYRVIEDTMNVKFTNRVDVLLGNEATYKTVDKGMKNPAEIFGICKAVGIKVVGFVDINHIPKTQAALAALVTGKTKSDLAVK